METKDVWLLGIGAFLGFLGSLLATFAAPPVGTVISKLKSGFIERNKSRALANFAVVQDLRTGKRDKYLYTLERWGFALFWMLLFALSGILFMIGPDQYRLPFGAFILITALSGMERIALATITVARLENFEHYRAQLLRRWPDIKLPDAE